MVPVYNSPCLPPIFCTWRWFQSTIPLVYHPSFALGDGSSLQFPLSTTHLLHLEMVPVYNSPCLPPIFCTWRWFQSTIPLVYHPSFALGDGSSLQFPLSTTHLLHLEMAFPISQRVHNMPTLGSSHCTQG